MARHFIIGGKRFYRRSLIRMDAAARAELERAGTITMHFPVEYPLEWLEPDFTRATVDEGWAAGKYLKVPGRFRDAGEDEWQPINRIFCPWGYPPDRLRIAHHSRYVFLQVVALQILKGVWTWLLTLSTTPPLSSPTLTRSA